MRSDIEKLINRDISEILNDSELSLLLLKTYSKLFLNGSQPNLCSKCMRDYHQKLIKFGLDKFTAMDKRTCKLKSHIVYIPKIGMQYSNDNITDEIALNLLAMGYVKESHFEVLPTGYDEKVSKIDLKIENKGKFTVEILDGFKAGELKDFLTEVTGETAETKKVAIELIMNWNNL